MVEVRAFTVREEATPFTMNEVLPVLTSTAAPQLYSVPVYATEWLELYLVCETNPVTVYFIGDMTPIEQLPGLTIPLEAETGVVRYVLVKGVPLNTPTTSGSHNLQIRWYDTNPGQHGVVTGWIRHHGIRRD